MSLQPPMLPPVMGRRKTTIRQVLASNMRRQRQALGISQERLAELARVHRTYVSSVERAQRNIGIDGVERIAVALGLSVSELLRS